MKPHTIIILVSTVLFICVSGYWIIKDIRKNANGPRDMLGIAVDHTMTGIKCIMIILITICMLGIAYFTR